MPRKRTREGPVAPVRKTGRRWSSPPPFIHGSEPLEAGAILEEVKTPLAVVLWQGFRDVLLWSSTPEERRGGLFSARAASARARALEELDVPPLLVSPLNRLSEILAGGSAAADPLADACREISTWAQAERLNAVALAYAQAVALVRSEDAVAAHAAGLIARRAGETARAESWFRRALTLGRRSGQWTSYAQSFLELGNMNLDAGRLDTAEKMFVRTRRVGRRFSLRELQARGSHGLFLVAVERSDREAAERHATKAASAYGWGHPEIARLALDVARMWVNGGEHRLAFELSQAVVPHLEDAAERIGALEAAAAAEDRTRADHTPSEAAATLSDALLRRLG